MKDFNLPELRMLSEEELVASAVNRFAHVRTTQLDELPNQVYKLMPKTILIPIPDDVVAPILHECVDPIPFDNFAARLDMIMGWDQKFIKLASRSPKDMEPYPVTHSGKTALHWIAGSMRCFVDLCDQSRVPDYQPKIALRDFVYGIRAEFRVFIKDNDLQGIAVYDERGNVHVEKGEVTEGRVARYWANNIRPHMKIDDYVFDLALRHNDELIVIEFNPYGLSDPIGFKSYDNINRIALFPVQYA
jgi:hypothetical protein